MSRKWSALLVLVACALGGACKAQTHAGPPPLVLDREIALPGVSGRIDHLALDVAGRRLFVAEVGAGAVDAVDIASGRVTRLAAGLSEPQGVAYLPALDEVIVATGGDGIVRFYSTRGGPELGRIPLGDDADDIRVEDGTGQVDVGFGSGGIALIDPKGRRLIRTLPLPAHPEGFQVDRGRVYVNLPRSDRTDVLDEVTGRNLASWPNTRGHFNFPMAADPGAGLVAVVYRLPARLVLFDAASGRTVQDLGVCGDADDLWFDARRRRIYVSCGSGSVDVFVRKADTYVREAQVATGGGARTSLYDPTLDRLFVAVPARGGKPAAIWSFRPQ
jgi:DNA-binding beta-propeller fold protein YncE